MNAKSRTEETRGGSRAIRLLRASGHARRALAHLHITRLSRPATGLPLSPLLRFVAATRHKAAALSLPLRPRVADLLAEAMLVMDEAMNTCESERAAPLEAARLVARIRSISDQVNLLMKTISD